MSKLKLPLFSLGASGSISGALTYLKRLKRQIVEKKPSVLDVKTEAQLDWRHMFNKAVALWHALSAAEKAEWESAARPKHMTGYAWFISQALRPNPGIYLPLQGGTMAGNIAMGGHKITGLPDPTANDEPLVKGTPATITELPALTNNKAWKGNASNRPTEAVFPTAPTKEFFAPITGWSGGDATVPDERGVLIDAAVEQVIIFMLIPQDFTTLDALEAILLPVTAEANMHFSFAARHGAYDGENYTLHSLSDPDVDIGATVAWQNLAHSIANFVTDLVAGDLLTVRVIWSATAVASNAYVRGLRLKYS